MGEISRFYAAMQLLRTRVHKEMPGQQICLLLSVAERSGVTMQELCRQLNMPQGSVSRNIKALSHYLERSGGRTVLKGRGLLRTEPSPTNPHALSVYLTEKGEALVAELGRVLCGPDAERERRHLAVLGEGLLAASGR